MTDLSSRRPAGACAARAVALLMLAFASWTALGAVAPRPASAARCGTMPVYARGIEAAGIVTRGVSCGAAMDVALGFYAQTIGSSGATVVGRFGCFYRGSQVRCAAGGRRASWREGRASYVIGVRRCGSVGVSWGRDAGGGAVGIRATHVSCRTARRFAVRCLNGGKRPWLAFRTDALVRPENTALFAFQHRRRLIAMGFVGGGGCHGDAFPD